MGKFDIGSFAASLSETVSKLDTQAPQLRYIDIDQLDAHEANFYAVDVSKLDTLADSIAMDGLQQPLVVTPGQDGRYTVISGHRRRAALRKLVEEDGREDLRRVPCLVKTYQSQALAELQLIMANSTARVLTSAEVMHQAQRMEDLLYQLKEEGYSFPGRMRAQVAEACQVSESKLARLKVINACLCSEYMDLFIQDKISEHVAYALAKLPQDFQRRIFKATKEPPVARVVDALTEEYKKGARWEPCLTCPDGKACTRGDSFLRHDCENEYSMCKGEKCCLECYGAKTDCYPCDRMCSKAQAVRKEKRNDAKAQALSMEGKVQAERRRDAQGIASRLVKAADSVGAAGNSRVQLGRYGSPWSVKDLRRFAAGDFGDTHLSGWEFGQDDVKRFAKAAETLGCSVDYIMGLTDEVQPGKSHQDSQWQTGKPTTNGYYWAICTGKISGGKLVWWQDDHWEPADVAMEINFCPMAWMPAKSLPDWITWEREKV